MKRIAILGGTFDPVHQGHLLLAEASREQHQLDQVLWVPARYPPHKAVRTLTDFEHRLAMVRLAIADHPGFALSQVETTRSGPSYAIHTLLDLQTEYPQKSWYWIIGWDAFQTLPRWYRSQEMVQGCTWLVVPRSRGTDWEAVPDVSVRWRSVQMPEVGISSSLVRQYCRDRRSIRYLVPDAVRAYITDWQLYSDPGEFRGNSTWNVDPRPS